MEEKVFESIEELKEFLRSVPEGTIVNVRFEGAKESGDDERVQ